MFVGIAKSKLVFISFFKNILLCVLGSTFLFSSEGIAQKTIKPRNLKKDLKELISSIEAHPDPYRINSKESFDQIIVHIKDQIETRKTVGEFYKLTSRF